MKERFIYLGKTKNGEPNLVPLSTNAFHVFEEVLAERQTQKVLNIEHARRVFLLGGKPIDTNIMGKWFRKVVKGKKKVRSKDGIMVVEYVDGTSIQDLRLYDLKHDRMTRERKRGATLSDLAEIAGQEDLRSTRRYAHQHLQTKRRIVKEFEPVFHAQTETSG